MTATAAVNGSGTTVGSEAAVQTGYEIPLAASAQVGRMQFVTASPSTGYAALNDGATPNQIGVGLGMPSFLSDVSATAGQAKVRTWQGEAHSIPASTVSGDSFTATDIGVPFYIANENTPGKLSNSSGNNRSLGGLVLGLLPSGLPMLWSGVVAWVVARAAHSANNDSAGSYAYPVDSGATVDYAAPIPMARSKRHGRITSITITPSAGLAATSGNDRTITIKKNDSLGVASAVTVGTFTTTTALVALVPSSFTLSGTSANLDMLETDFLTIENSHAGSGAVIPASAIAANMKVQ